MFNILQHCFYHLLGKALLTSQFDTLLFCVAGSLISRQLGIAPIGLHALGKAKIKHKKKRVDRFLGNERVDVDAISLSIVRVFALRGKRVIIATDWTQIKNGLWVLTSAVVARGRAIPFFFTVVDTKETRLKSVELDHMKQLCKLLEGIECVHVLDAGYDDAPFLAEISAFCKFVVRVARGICYRPVGSQKWEKIGSLEKRNRCYDFGRVEFTKEHETEVRLVGIHDWLQKDAWFLVTNLHDEDRKEIVKWYGRRFTIEEAFKDLKDLRAGFQLKGHLTKSPERLHKLLMIGAVSYLLCTAAGLHGEEHGLHRGIQVSSRKTRENAIWRVGRVLLLNELISAESVISQFSQICLDFGDATNAKAA